MKAGPRSQGINSLTASVKVPWEALLIGSWQFGAGWFCWWCLIWVIFRAGLLGSMVMCYFSLSFCFLSYLMFQNQSPCSACEIPEEMRDWLLNLLVPFISVHPPSLWCMGWLLRSSQHALKGSTTKQSGRQGEQKFGISWIKPQGILWLMCCEEENRTRPLNLYILFGSGAIVHNRKSGTNDTHHHGHYLFRWDLIPLYFFYFLCLCCKQSTRPLPGIDKYIRWIPLCSCVSVKCWLWVWPCIKSRVILECCCALMQ